MNADDKRHGLVAGYVAGCRDACCRRAISLYNENLRLERLRGCRPRLVPTVGAKRRLEALACLGWSHAQVSLRLGYSKDMLPMLMRKYPTIRAATHDRIAAVYEELCMTPPPETTPTERMSVQRTKARARRLGWLPPLAYDDIDDPNERPNLRPLAHTPKSDVDEAVVLRVMAGERLPMTTGDRREVVRRLRARDWSEEQIYNVTGISKATSKKRFGDAAA